MRAHSTPQALACVAGCLRSAAPDHPSNLQVAQELHCNRHTVAVGAVATLRRPQCLQMRRVRGDRGAFPPSARLDVLSMATRNPPPLPGHALEP